MKQNIWIQIETALKIKAYAKSMLKVTKLGKYRIITFDSENPRESQATHFQVRFPSDVFSCDFLICIHVWRVFFLLFFDICSCVACVFQWFAFVFMCGMCSCVACVFQQFSCVFMCGVCFSMTFWYVFMCGMCHSMIFFSVHAWRVFFNDFFVCSCVVCFPVVFRRPTNKQTKNRWFCRGGGGSNLLQIHPNVKLSAFPETTYKLHGTLCIQEVSAVSAKKIKQHGDAIPNMLWSVFKPWFLPVYKFKTAWWRIV